VAAAFFFFFFFFFFFRLASMAGSSTSSIMDNLFQDLIKSMCLQLLTESSFISKSIEEIHREIKSTDPQTKSTALQKHTYLYSIHGIDMSWASFHVNVLFSLPSQTNQLPYRLNFLQRFDAASNSLGICVRHLRHRWWWWWRKGYTQTQKHTLCTVNNYVKQQGTIDDHSPFHSYIFNAGSSSHHQLVFFICRRKYMFVYFGVWIC